MTFIAPPADPGGGLLPSVIAPTAVVITFNNATPIYANESPTFLTQDNPLNYPVFSWGSFDGGTNVIVFPRHSSVEALALQASSSTGISLDTYEPAGSNGPVEGPILQQYP
jgi:hypothetical protein